MAYGLKRAAARLWRPVAALAGVLAAMELIVSLKFSPVYVPAPSAVIMHALSKPQLVIGSLSATVSRAATGFSIAAILTLAFASIAVLQSRIQNSLYNFSATLHSIPIIATTPLLALWVGTGAPLQVTIAALACQFPMLTGAIQGLRSADPSHRELMQLLSASGPQTLRYLLFPSALPYIFAGLKVAAPAAVLGTITAEWAGADLGIGAMLLYALFSYDTPTVWLSVVLTCLLSGAGYGLWALVERLALPVQASVDLAK